MDSFPGGYVSHDPNSQDVKAAHSLEILGTSLSDAISVRGFLS